MSFFDRIKPQRSSVDFMAFSRPAMLLSLCLIIASIALLSTRGLNFGIDFQGGLLMEVDTIEPADLTRLRQALSQKLQKSVTLQTFGSENEVLIRVQADETDRDKAIEIIREVLPENAIERRKEYVGASVGRGLIQQAIWAVALSLAAMLIYIWLRFEWQFGIGAIAALFHDVIITLGFFSLTWLEFNLSTIAAILTIVGYSINDTVVVFDRVRESFRKFNTKTLAQLLNISLNETLSRTILTSCTTLVALLCLFLFGGEIIRGFSAALLLGVIIGTWSSLFIAVPTLLRLPVKLTDFNKHREEKVV